MFKSLFITCILGALPQCQGDDPAPADPAPASTTVAPAPARVIIGELQTGSFDVSPPTRLDVSMWQGTLDGKNVRTRCDHMAGTIGSENGLTVCYGVDY